VLQGEKQKQKQDKRKADCRKQKERKKTRFSLQSSLSEIPLFFPFNCYPGEG